MSQAVTTSSTISAFERLRHWWQRIAAAVLPGAGAEDAGGAVARILSEVKPLLEASRA